MRRMLKETNAQFWGFVMKILGDLFIFLVTLLGGYFANDLDCFNLKTSLGDFGAYIIYLLIVLVILLAIVWVGFFISVFIRKRRKLAKAHGITLEPRDYGLDGQMVRNIGFSISGDYQPGVRLEEFWFSGHKKPDEMRLRYPLNLSSHNLRQTPDGQFYLATTWKYGTAFSLVLEDGYYGLMVLNGYYKARISVRLAEKQAPCFDVLMRYKLRDKIAVVKIIGINCDDKLEYIPEEERIDFENGDKKNWSTVPNFQPNQMYR